jgi:integrase
VAVVQLPDGRWSVQGRPGYWPDEPKRRKEYFGRGERARLAALNRDEELRQRKYKRPHVNASSILFDALAEKYYEHGATYMRAATIAGLSYRIDVLNDHFGGVPAGDITPALTDKFVTKRLQKVTRTTVASDLTYLKRILNWGVERRLIGINPIEKYRKPSRDDAVIRPPSPDEIHAILTHAPEHIRRALILAYYTGTRPGAVELFRLRYSDIDWNRLTITITSAAKGGPRSGIIPLHPDLSALIHLWETADKALYEERKDNPKYKTPAVRPDLIIHWRWQRVRRIKTGFDAAKKAAGITRRLRPYDFRHAPITAMNLSGMVDPKTASTFSRHSRPDTMARVYTHSDLDALRRAVATIPSLDLGEPGERGGTFAE